MRKDALFIVVVLLFGLAGVYYTNQNTNDTLKALRTNQTVSRSKETSSNINQSSRLSISNTQKEMRVPSVGLDISNSIETNNYNTNLDIKSVDNNIFESRAKSSISKEEKNRNDSHEGKRKHAKNKKEFNWDQEFASWSLVLLDNVTGLTGVEDLRNERGCRMTLVLKGGRSVMVDFKNVVRVKSSGNVVRFEPFTSFKFAYLKNPAEVRKASSRLVGLCNHSN